MAIVDKLTGEFLQALKEVENILLMMQFERDSFIEKGFAYFVKYKKGDCIVEFLFGPAEYQVEMIIYTSNGKFAFKDLLQIPVINEWVNSNRYKQRNGRNVKDELFWFIELLKYSLPIVE